jgi:hypothetical protein
MVELELLAICWAVKKCSNFIHGLPLKLFETCTDHAPLIPILNKYTLPEIENNRLQRLRAKLDHLQFHAVWIKGSDNTEADILAPQSRVRRHHRRQNNGISGHDCHGQPVQKVKRRLHRNTATR